MSDRVLSEQQQLFLEVLFDDECKGNLTLAKRKAGYSEKTPGSSVAKSLINEIEAETRRFIASSTTEAAFSFFQVLKDPAKLGNREKMAAAKEILDRAGLVKTEKVEVTTKEPLFILPAKVED